MKKLKVIKTKQGRVTIQQNSFGVIEIKVRNNGVTHKIGCSYESLSEIEKVVDALLHSDIEKEIYSLRDRESRGKFEKM